MVSGEEFQVPERKRQRWMCFPTESHDAAEEVLQSSLPLSILFLVQHRFVDPIHRMDFLFLLSSLNYIILIHSFFSTVTTFHNAAYLILRNHRDCRMACTRSTGS